MKKKNFYISLKYSQLNGELLHQWLAEHLHNVSITTRFYLIEPKVGQNKILMIQDVSALEKLTPILKHNLQDLIP